MILNMTTFITFKALELMAKIEKSLKFKPNYKIVEEMKAEAEEIRQKALVEGELVGIDKGLIQGKHIGKQEGLIEGKLEEKIEIVKEMLKENYDIKSIIKLTKLSEKEINKLR